MGCPESIREALEGLKGIKEVKYNIEEDIFLLKHNPQEISFEQIKKTIEDLGRKRSLPYQVRLVR